MSNTIRPRPSTISFKKHPSMTEQAHKEDVCIQNILRKSRKTGIITHVNQYKGEYLNMIDAPNFQEYQNILAEASSMFESVPSHIRQDFDNDPAKYLAFMQNPENFDEIEKYGLDASHLTPLIEAQALKREEEQRELDLTEQKEQQRIQSVIDANKQQDSQT
ncbi:internal scaffolding protein [Microviridae sp.]|nr:internal scaffolding protein [Microviridae sp.]